jgi:hypothetical protein
MGAALVNPRLIVVHVAQSPDLSGVDAWFHNPAAEVSAHFGIDKDGSIDQWVPLDRQAWAEMNYNDCAWSIEHVGYSGQKLTAKQLEASVELIKWLADLIDDERGLAKGTASKRTNVQSGVGVIGHGELGVAGGNHPNCPGTPILDQFNVALREPPAHSIAKVSEEVKDLTEHVRETAALQKVSSTMATKIVSTPTKSQVGVFVAEAGALTVYINDFIKFAHPGGTELIMLNAAAAGVTWISHHFNKKKAATQAAPTPPPAS